jgi:hypothetical protein
MQKKGVRDKVECIAQVKDNNNNNNNNNIIRTLNGGLPVDSVTTRRHNTQIHISHRITYHTQRKHSTYSCTNNIGHITHSE